MRRSRRSTPRLTFVGRPASEGLPTRAFRPIVAPRLPSRRPLAPTIPEFSVERPVWNALPISSVPPWPTLPTRSSRLTPSRRDTGGHQLTMSSAVRPLPGPRRPPIRKSHEPLVCGTRTLLPCDWSRSRRQHSNVTTKHVPRSMEPRCRRRCSDDDVCPQPSAARRSLPPLSSAEDARNIAASTPRSTVAALCPPLCAAPTSVLVRKRTGRTLIPCATARGADEGLPDPAVGREPHRPSHLWEDAVSPRIVGDHSHCGARAVRRRRWPSPRGGGRILNRRRTGPDDGQCRARHLTTRVHRRAEGNPRATPPPGFRVGAPTDPGEAQSSQPALDKSTRAVAHITGSNP